MLESEPENFRAQPAALTCNSSHSCEEIDGGSPSTPNRYSSHDVENEVRFDPSNACHTEVSPNHHGLQDWESRTTGQTLSRRSDTTDGKIRGRTAERRSSMRNGMSNTSVTSVHSVGQPRKKKPKSIASISTSVRSTSQQNQKEPRPRAVPGAVKNHTSLQLALEFRKEFQELRKRRSELTFRILRWGDERQHLRRQRHEILREHLRANIPNSIGLEENQCLALDTVLDQAFDKLSAFERGQDSVENELIKADRELAAAEGRLKEIISPDDASDCLEIFEDFLEDINLSFELDSQPAVEVAVDLSQFQIELLLEALYSNISDPDGIADLDVLLAYPPQSSSELSSGSENDVRNEAEVLRFRKAFNIELEVHLVGVQFQSYPSYTGGIDPEDLHLLSSTPMQKRKRHRDLDNLAQTIGFDDFWRIFRTSWLEFSRFVGQMAHEYGPYFKFIKSIDILAVDSRLEELERAEGNAQSLAVRSLESLMPRFDGQGSSISTRDRDGHSLAPSRPQLQPAQSTTRLSSCLSYYGSHQRRHPQSPSSGRSWASATESVLPSESIDPFGDVAVGAFLNLEAIHGSG